MTTQTIITQGIGFIGVIFFILSFQIKSNKALYLMQMTGTAMFCIQFLMLGALSGCFNLIVIMIRNIMLTGYEKYAWIRWKGWIGIFIALCIVILVFTWDGPLSLLPFIALVGGIIGYWTNNARNIRLSNLVCSCPAWLTYDFLVGSIGGMVNESIMIVSILVSIYRYGWKNMGENSFGDSDKNIEDN